MNERVIRGTVYILGDNIDTDQILTAEYMKINPASPSGYKELGTLAMCGLPDHYEPFVNPDIGQAYHPIIVAGHNFGCGSSREHAPMALGASGVQAVIAESFARIFYRNCISTGEILPVECRGNIKDVLKHGDLIEIYPDRNQIFIERSGSWFSSEGLGDMLDIVNAGGLFKFARQTGRLG